MDVNFSARIALILMVALAAQPAAGATIRYDRAANVITVDRGAVTTLTTLKAALPQAPIRLVDKDKKTWLLGANVLLTGGSMLRLHGGSAGGDVDELRLKSDNNSGPHAFVSITADHGTLDIRATRVTSWDTAANGPDTEHDTYGRAFIRARSRMRSMLLIPLQSRMDIVDSEVAFLGYDANESYGLVWKVVAPEPFAVRVRARLWRRAALAHPRQLLRAVRGRRAQQRVARQPGPPQRAVRPGPAHALRRPAHRGEQRPRQWQPRHHRAPALRARGDPQQPRVGQWRERHHAASRVQRRAWSPQTRFTAMPRLASSCYGMPG